jgi:hypothetical protein
MIERFRSAGIQEIRAFLASHMRLQAPENCLYLSLWQLEQLGRRKWRTSEVTLCLDASRLPFMNSMYRS